MLGRKLTKLAQDRDPGHLPGMTRSLWANLSTWRLPLQLVLVACAAILPGAQAHAQAPTANPRALHAIAPLQWVEPDAIEYTLARIRGLGDPAQQLREVADAGLEQMACRGLVDFRGLSAVRGGGFGYRDQFRGRSWMRPALARVVLRAHEAFRAERPANWVTVADATQPGCGQLSYGTLVRMVEDAMTPEARASLARMAGLNAVALDDDLASEPQRLLGQVQFLSGQPGVAEMRTAADFPLEHDRFHTVNQSVLVEHRILARGKTEDGEGRTVLRVATRRFALLPGLPKPRQQKRLISGMHKQFQRVWQDGLTIRSELVEDFDPQAGTRQVWLTHKVHQAAGVQVVVLSGSQPDAHFSPDDAIEVRLSKWHDRKPGNGNGEVRWRPTAQGWQRWLLLSEAGHMTHAGGRDTDISYVTADNTEHLRVRLNRIDVAGTWRWWELLDETARAAGTPLERIYVDGKVRALFNHRLPPAAKTTRLWQDVVAVSAGHDAHHHVRLASAPAEREGAALVDLFTPGAPAESGVAASVAGDAWIRAQPVCMAPLVPASAPRVITTTPASVKPPVRPSAAFPVPTVPQHTPERQPPVASHALASPIR